MNPHDTHFRPDIEGLRAVAVMLVVASHARIPGLSGGFIGVDIFFVISGFLITQQLTRELHRSGTIDIGAFYGRRIRRLLPAFTVVLFVVLLALRVLFSPLEQPELYSTALSASLYFSNVHFAQTATQYLAESSLHDPLLHTWSLGVEEQFYMAWPLFLLMAAAFSKPRPHDSALRWLLGAVIAGSLALNLYLTPIRQPDAFFLPFTRAWEFGLGAAIAIMAASSPPWSSLLPRYPSRAASRTAILFALALILVPALMLSETSLFPGMAALAPALGAALLILLLPHAWQDDPALRLLRTPFMQWTGRRSYSWYLWHWPLLVIGRLFIPTPSLWTDVALAALALGIAAGSYRFVENPLRSAPLLQPTLASLLFAALLGFGGGTIALAAGSSAIEISTGDRFSHLAAARTDLPPIYANGCEPPFYDTRLIECASGPDDAPHTAVLIGDSHAGQWFSALEAALPPPQWRVILMTKSSCPLLALDMFNPRIGRTFDECRQWQDKALARLRTLRPDVVIASSYEHYELSPTEWRTGMEGLMLPIADSTRHLFILRDTPSPGQNPLFCLSRREWNTWVTLPSCSFEPDASLSTMVLNTARDVARERDNITMLDLTRAICPTSPCSFEEGGVLKFRDGHHLTDSFARTLSGNFRSAFRPWSQGPEPAPL
ncbi:MAG TPA: acyltransferase family protein [Moraxellaceae bacterium]|nr:acyltransferase family protein [Moraxellaceae bacterium]